MPAAGRCSGGGFVATQDVFSEEELVQLRGFPEIGRTDLIRHFTLTSADEAFLRRFRTGRNVLGAAVHAVLAGVRAGRGGLGAGGRSGPSTPSTSTANWPNSTPTATARCAWPRQWTPAWTGRSPSPDPGACPAVSGPRVAGRSRWGDG
nr:DUF4158 domain-containing protein [Salinispora arenicola]